MSVELVCLSDDRAGACPSEHGLSILVKTKEGSLLLDSGASGLFLENANRLGVEIGKIAVLTHGHYDHGDGLKFLPEGMKLYSHPDAFLKRYRKSDSSYIGIDRTREDLERAGFEIVLSKEPVEIFKGAWFLGELPRRTDFEDAGTLWKLHDGRDDLLLDDSGIALETPRGLVVLSGCGHAGIGNAVLRAIEVTGQDNVFAVGGGFHLKDSGEKAEKTALLLKRLGVSLVLLSHCTCADAGKLFSDAGLETRELSSGTVIEL